MADATNIENSAKLQENIQGIAGTKQWGDNEPLRDELVPPKPDFSTNGAGSDSGYPPPDPEEFFDEAERAKARFAVVSGGETPEPVGDEKVSPEQARAQERLVRAHQEQTGDS